MASYWTPAGSRYRISADAGQIWGEEKSFPDVCVVGPTGIALSDGTVLYFSTNGSCKRFVKKNKPLEFSRTLSTDDFLHYEQAGTATVYLPNPTDEIISGVMDFAPIFERGRCVELDNGDLLALMFGDIEGDVGIRVMIVKSNDQGKTWHYRATVAHYDGDPNPELPGEFPGYSENSLALLPNGQLLAVMRTLGGGELPCFRPLYCSWSDDLGKTWTKPTPTKPHLNSIWPILATLDNGVIACLYSRPGVHVAFSTDTGLTWGNQITLSDTVLSCLEQGDLIKVGHNKLLALAYMGE